ncbi:MAG: hypothetical protein EOO16_23110 [Chitinophagaceae bacterium]|nr:MAG: hypothetical protein EOO16_23110 [Chitinophagaceae bacterium]
MASPYGLPSAKQSPALRSLCVIASEPVLSGVEGKQSPALRGVTARALTYLTEFIFYRLPITDYRLPITDY